MKLRDIVVGEEYAVSQGAPDYPDRAVVLEVSKTMTRRVYSGNRWDFGGHPTTGPGVRVRFIRNGNESAIAPTQVLRPWREQQVLNDQKELQRKRQQRRQQVARSLSDQLQTILMQGHPAGDARVTVYLNRGTARNLLGLLSDEGYDAQLLYEADVDND